MENSPLDSRENGREDTESASLADEALEEEDGVMDHQPSPPKNHYLALLIGQAIALIAATMNASSFVLINKHKVHTQLLQLFIMYLFLSLHIWRTKPPNPDVSHRLGPLRLRRPWYIYMCMSLLDVCPNFLALISFKYTSLTSTTLLGSLTVPSTMLFSRIILRRLFGRHHYIGVVLCVLGGCLTIYMDSGLPRTHNIVGDILAVCAALLYGLGDTISEYAVKEIDRFEYLGMLGIFGSLLTGLTFPFIEYHAIRELVGSWSLPIAGLFVLYISTVLLYYTTASRFLVHSDATLLNLSLQSVNLWAVLFTLLTDANSFPHFMFFVALVLVVSGVFVYETSCNVCRKRTRSSSEVEIVGEHFTDYQTVSNDVR